MQLRIITGENFLRSTITFVVALLLLTFGTPCYAQEEISQIETEKLIDILLSEAEAKEKVEALMDQVETMKLALEQRGIELASVKGIVLEKDDIIAGLKSLNSSLKIAFEEATKGKKRNLLKGILIGVGIGLVIATGTFVAIFVL